MDELKAHSPGEVSGPHRMRECRESGQAMPPIHYFSIFASVLRERGSGTLVRRREPETKRMAAI